MSSVAGPRIDPDAKRLRLHRVPRTRKTPVAVRFLWLILIFAAAQQAFDLVPWARVHGEFNVADVGNLMIWIGVGWVLFRGRGSRVMWNFVAILVLVYIVMFGIHVSLATFNFGQTVQEGIIAVRHQFYYLSFFLFVGLLRNEDEIFRFLNVLEVIAFGLCILALVNYFGPTVLYHRWAEGHGMRSGVVRGYVPATTLVTMASIWQVVKWADEPRLTGKAAWATMFFVGIHFIEQTRGRLLALGVSVFLALLWRRRYGRLWAFLGAYALAAAAVSVVVPENPLTGLFTSAVEDIAEQKGGWSESGRVLQLETALQEFAEHPILGSGTIALHVTDESQTTAQNQDLEVLAKNKDLGLPFWLRNYGLLGVVWLVLFFGVLIFWGVQGARNGSPRSAVLARFAVVYLVAALASGVTLNYFTNPDGILSLCLSAAIITRLRFGSNLAPTSGRPDAVVYPARASGMSPKGSVSAMGTTSGKIPSSAARGVLDVQR